MNNATELSSLIERLEGGRVLCVGDLILDRYVEGSVDRISPEGPIPVLSIKREVAMPGGAGNVLLNLCSLGVAVDLVAALGEDAAGDEVVALLKAASNVKLTLVRVADRRTSIKTRFLAGGQQLLRTDKESLSYLEPKDCEAVLAAAEAAVGDCSVMVLSDYGKGLLTQDVLSRLIELGHDANIPIIVDPKGIDYTRYRGASLLTPNRYELSQATGQPTDSDEAIVSACKTVIEKCGVGGVLATRGDEGATLVHDDKIIQLTARRPQKIFDVSGAGDTIVATLSAGLSAGAPISMAAELANTAAGVVVGKVGTAVVWPMEILAAIHEQELMSGEAKVVTLKLALDRIAVWRRQGLKVGFTNGCFDLLHPGHISLFEQSREVCDRLIVGLNSDESVKRLKGADRPIQTESSRASVLASLAAVDLVIVFSEDTPLTLIQELKPEVLVKGADYQIDDVVGASEVRTWGGSVLLTELAQGYSTSKVVDKLSSKVE